VGRACGLCGVSDNFSPCRLRLRLWQRTTAGEFSRSPRSPVCAVPAAQDPGLSRIYLPESGPARATRADGLAGERTAGSGSEALCRGRLGLTDAENELRVVRHAVAPSKPQRTTTSFRTRTESRSAWRFCNAMQRAAIYSVCPFCTRRRLFGRRATVCSSSIQPPRFKRGVILALTEHVSREPIDDPLAAAYLERNVVIRVGGSELGRNEDLAGNGPVHRTEGRGFDSLRARLPQSRGAPSCPLGYSCKRCTGGSASAEAGAKPPKARRDRPSRTGQKLPAGLHFSPAQIAGAQALGAEMFVPRAGPKSRFQPPRGGDAA